MGGAALMEVVNPLRPNRTVSPGSGVIMGLAAEAFLTCAAAALDLPGLDKLSASQFPAETSFFNLCLIYF